MISEPTYRHFAEALLPTRADWNTLFQLKQRWQVPLAALLLRARNLNRMSESAYLTGVKALSARGCDESNPYPSANPNSPPAYAPHRHERHQRHLSGFARHVVDTLVRANAA